MKKQSLPASCEPIGLFRSAGFGRFIGSLSVRVCRNLLVCADLTYPDSVAALTYLAWTGKFKMATLIHGYDVVDEQGKQMTFLRSFMQQHKQTLVRSSSNAHDPADSYKRHGACDFILEKARRHSRRRPLPVLLLGAPTDLAAALQADPTVAERIEIVAAGFESWPQGGLRQDADIAAWQALLDSDVPITFASTEASKSNLPITNPLLAGRFSPAAAKLSASTPRDTLRLQLPGGEAAPSLSGLLAAAFLAVGGQTTAYHRPVLGNDGIFLHGSGTDPLPCQTCLSEPRIQWIKTINSAVFLKQLQRAFAAADKKRS